MYSILNTFFKEMEVVNHQLVSYNDFIPTEDNPDSGMQQVFDTLRVTEDDLPGEMKLARSSIDMRVLSVPPIMKYPPASCGSSPSS